MLNKLAMVQVDASELACMSSIAHLGTRNSNLQLSKRPLPKDLKEAVENLNSIRGSKKRRKIEKEPVRRLFCHCTVLLFCSKKEIQPINALELLELRFLT